MSAIASQPPLRYRQPERSEGRPRPSHLVESTELSTVTQTSLEQACPYLPFAKAAKDKAPTALGHSGEVKAGATPPVVHTNSEEEFAVSLCRCRGVFGPAFQTGRE